MRPNTQEYVASAGQGFPPVGQERNSESSDDTPDCDRLEASPTLTTSAATPQTDAQRLLFPDSGGTCRLVRRRGETKTLQTRAPERASVRRSGIAIAVNLDKPPGNRSVFPTGPRDSRRPDSLVSEIQRPHIARVKPLNAPARHAGLDHRCGAVQHLDVRCDGKQNVGSQRDAPFAPLVSQCLAQQAHRTVFEDL